VWTVGQRIAAVHRSARAAAATSSSAASSSTTSGTGTRDPAP
jgi:hypothetical protein